MNPNEESLDDMFAALREAPLEVDMQTIQGMVTAFPSVPGSGWEWGSYFSLNNIIMGIITTSFIAGAVYLFSGTAEAQTETRQYYAAEQVVSPKEASDEVRENSAVPLADISEVPAPPAPKEPSEEPEPERHIPPAMDHVDPAAIPNASPDVPPMEPIEPPLPPLAPKRILSTESFHEVVCQGALDVIIMYDSKHEVWAEGDDQLIEKMEVSVKGDKLVISMSKTSWKEQKKWAKDAWSNTRVYVNTPDLRNLSLRGSGDVEFSGFKSLDDLDISIQGSGNVTGKKDINARNLDIDIQGSGDVVISGKGEQVEISIAGSGDVDADEFRGTHVNVRVAGSGDVQAYASQEATVHVAGSGDVTVYGSPGKVNKSKVGSGDISIR